MTDEDVDKRIEGLQQMHAEIIDKGADATAALGDFVIIKYQGFHNGEPVKEVVSEAYPMELGNGRLMPEFENALVGMKVDEEKEIEVPFADDYPDKSIASKTLLFKMTMKEIKRKRLPEVNESRVVKGERRRPDQGNYAEDPGDSAQGPRRACTETAPGKKN